MSIGFFRKKETNTLENKVILIQNGDDYERNKLLKEYQPFIKKAASKACKFYIDESRDEFSVGLLAFNEAIDQYREGQGTKFLTFADMVIRRRVIDHIRKEARQKKLEYLQHNTIDDEEYEESYVERKAAIEYYEMQQESENRIYEIEEYGKVLENFGINFLTLSKVSPKHFDARENAKEIAKLIADDASLKEYLLEKKQLPIKELLNLVTCSRKTIERNRKYIIAVALIYIKNFKSLSSYIDG